MQVRLYRYKNDVYWYIKLNPFDIELLLPLSVSVSLLQGLLFLHNSELGCHGNLKSSNCVVNSRWTLQVSDFGLLEIRAKTYRKEDEHAYYRSKTYLH